ncbi:MAG: hypothetical protein NZ553_04280 [Caldilinea sp.]|nr:hypothetical protein [Caldilinea sp.]MDW8439672.1 hypothetical protein [Caldilineaceae bacterium]
MQLPVAQVMSSGLLNAQFWSENSFWRPAAFWAGVAGALSVGITQNTIDWRTLALALILVDVLWGSVWRLAGGRQQLLPLNSGVLPRAPIWLPYLQPGSPAARMFSGDHSDVWSLAFHVALPTVLLATLAAAVLGIEALLLTATVAFLAILGWIARHTLQGIPLLLTALIAIGLPWLLVMQQVTPQESGSGWPPLILAACWVMHYWGEMRILVDSRDVVAMMLLATAEIGICAFLILMQAPLWLAMIILLFLPTWLMVAQGASVGRRMQPLWLFALLLSALALGQTI